MYFIHFQVTEVFYEQSGMFHCMWRLIRRDIDCLGIIQRNWNQTGQKWQAVYQQN